MRHGCWQRLPSQFLECFNERFALPAAKPENLHRPLNVKTDRLNGILCHREQRYVSEQLTMSYDRKQIILERNERSEGLGGKYVDLYEFPNGTLEVRSKGHLLPYRLFSKDQRVSHTAVVENKRLSHALTIIGCATKVRKVAVDVPGPQITLVIEGRVINTWKSGPNHEAACDAIVYFPHFTSGLKGYPHISAGILRKALHIRVSGAPCRCHDRMNHTMAVTNKPIAFADPEGTQMVLCDNADLIEVGYFFNGDRFRASKHFKVIPVDYPKRAVVCEKQRLSTVSRQPLFLAEGLNRKVAQAVNALAGDDPNVPFKVFQDVTHHITGEPVFLLIYIHNIVEDAINAFRSAQPQGPPPVKENLTN